MDSILPEDFVSRRLPLLEDQRDVTWDSREEL